MSAGQQEKIADLRYRVALCTMQDVVRSGDTMELTRAPVARVWAKVDQQNNLPSYVSPAGYTIREPASNPSHHITVRKRVNMDFTTAAWVYEERLKAPPRWYKVLGVQDDGTDWVVMTCRLVERSEMVLPPASAALTAQPSDVVL